MKVTWKGSPGARRISWSPPNVSDQQQIRTQRERELGEKWSGSGVCRYCGPERCIHGGES